MTDADRISAALDVGASAVISECEAYRYWLTRGQTPRLPIIMLNPSTADETTDDPTIRRCMSFARREGYSGITVCNLFALRATDPRALKSHADPIGPNNIHYWRALVSRAPEPKTVLCAWGSFVPDATICSAAETTLRNEGAQLVCLGTNKDGSPKHPLYVAGDTPLQAWRGLPAID